MSIRLYLDEDVDPLLAQVLRDRGIDCLSTQETKNCGNPDRAQLTFAATHTRTILTFNVKDFAKLSQRYLAEGNTHSGIILSQHLPFRELLRRALLLLQKHGQEELTNRVLWLQDYQMPPTVS